MRRTHLVIRSASANPASLISAVRREIAAIPQIPAQYEEYSQILRVSLARERLAAYLWSAFGVVALLLAGIGVYGLMSYSIARRTSELAIRAALGASRLDVFALVVRRAVRVGVAGIAIGVVVAIATRDVIASQLYEMSTLDWRVFSSVSCALLAIIVLASCVSVRRATKLDAATMLRME